MLLSPSKAASDSELCQSISHGTTCDVTRHHTHWLLQLNPCRSIPACRLVPLQRVQNAASRLVLNLDRRAHIISLALQQLHWLPVKHRVTFKIATLMHQILQKRCPSYLAKLVTFNTTDSQRRQVRSSTTRAAAVRCVCTNSVREACIFCLLSWGVK